MPEKDGDEGKSTKSVVNKKQKQMMGEEGYDIARDMGRVRPSKDKKDATSYPPSEEMKKLQKVNKGPSALDRVKKKYKGQIMDVKKEEVELDEKCWKGYEKKGMKTMFGKRYPNCVKKEETEVVREDDMKGMSVKSGHKRPTKSGAGMTKKGVEAYRRRNPGSKLKTAVTTPPSKLKAGSKAANRRKSYCARSAGQMKKFPKAAKDPNSRLRQARRRWNC